MLLLLHLKLLLLLLLPLQLPRCPSCLVQLLQLPMVVVVEYQVRCSQWWLG